MGNNPVGMVDPDGGESTDPNNGVKAGQPPPQVLPEVVVTAPRFTSNPGIHSNTAAASVLRNLNMDVNKANVKSSFNSPSTADVLLAGVGTASLYAERQSQKIKTSRSGYTSGKVSSTSPRVYSKSVARKVLFIARSVSWGLTIGSAINTELEYSAGGMSTGRRNYNHMNSIVGLALPQSAIPIAVGDYLGQTYSEEITNDVTQPGGYMFEGMKSMLQLLGLPTSPPK
jgi:hypothetical protein